MPDDIRNMTAEMRRNYDNPDPRPQLRRGNPNAVNAFEEAARQRELLRRETEPIDVAARGYRSMTESGSVAERILGFAGIASLAGMKTAEQFAMGLVASHGSAELRGFMAKLAENTARNREIERVRGNSQQEKYRKVVRFNEKTNEANALEAKARETEELTARAEAEEASAMLEAIRDRVDQGGLTLKDRALLSLYGLSAGIPPKKVAEVTVGAGKPGGLDRADVNKLKIRLSPEESISAAYRGFGDSDLYGVIDGLGESAHFADVGLDSHIMSALVNKFINEPGFIGTDQEARQFVLGLPGAFAIKSRYVARKDFPRDAWQEVMSTGSGRVVDSFIKKSKTVPEGMKREIVDSELGAKMTGEGTLGDDSLVVGGNRGTMYDMARASLLKHHSGELSESDVETMYGKGDRYVRFHAVQSDKATEGILRDAIGRNENFVSGAAAGNPKLPKDAADAALRSSSDTYVLWNLSKRKDADPDALQAAFTKATDMLEAIQPQSKGPSYDYLANLNSRKYNDMSPAEKIRTNLIRNPAFPQEAVDRLFDKTYPKSGLGFIDPSEVSVALRRKGTTDKYAALRTVWNHVGDEPLGQRLLQSVLPRPRTTNEKTGESYESSARKSLFASLSGRATESASEELGKANETIKKEIEKDIGRRLSDLERKRKDVSENADGSSHIVDPILDRLDPSTAGSAIRGRSGMGGFVKDTLLETFSNSAEDSFRPDSIAYDSTMNAVNLSLSGDARFASQILNATGGPHDYKSGMVELPMSPVNYGDLTEFARVTAYNGLRALPTTTGSPQFFHDPIGSFQMPYVGTRGKTSAGPVETVNRFLEDSIARRRENNYSPFADPLFQYLAKHPELTDADAIAQIRSGIIERTNGIIGRLGDTTLEDTSELLRAVRPGITPYRDVTIDSSRAARGIMNKFDLKDRSFSIMDLFHTGNFRGFGGSGQLVRLFPKAGWMQNAISNGSEMYAFDGYTDVSGGIGSKPNLREIESMRLNALISGYGSSANAAERLKTILAVDNFLALDSLGEMVSSGDYAPRSGRGFRQRDLPYEVADSMIPHTELKFRNPVEIGTVLAPKGQTIYNDRGREEAGRLLDLLTNEYPDINVIEYEGNKDFREKSVGIVDDLRMASKGGNAGGSDGSSGGAPAGGAAPDPSGPRIVINPSTFKNGKDALCVAFDEAFRVIMEMNGFDPQSEPTEKQRKFFSDTAYANDETMLRRTILARICTFDTSVSDPTDEQLQEAVEFLDTVMEIGAPQNEWEQRSVQRIRDAIAKTVGQPRTSGKTPEPPAEGPSNAAAGGGKTDEDKPNGTFDTKEAVDYRDNDGSWRTSTGQLIGDDGQKKQYDQAKEALKGSGAYYDNGMFRTQDGSKIGGNLESVQKWAAQAAEASKTDGSYFDGKWRDPTGKVMNFSGNDGSTFSAGGGSSGQSNMDGRTLGEDGFLRDSATGKLDMFGAQTTKGTTVSGQGYAAQPGDAVAQGKSRLTSGEQAWQERKRQSTEAWAKRTGQTDSAGYENDAPPAPDAGVENGSEVSGAKREAGRIGSGDVHQMNGPSKTGRRLGEVDIHRMR